MTGQEAGDEATNRTSRVDEGSPIEFGQETAQKVEVGGCGTDDELDIGKGEGEVVLCAIS